MFMCNQKIGRERDVSLLQIFSLVSRFWKQKSYFFKGLTLRWLVIDRKDLYQWPNTFVSCTKIKYLRN